MLLDFVGKSSQTNLEVNQESMPWNKKIEKKTQKKKKMNKTMKMMKKTKQMRG